MEKFSKKYNIETDINLINRRDKEFSLDKKDKDLIGLFTCMLPMSDKLHFGHIYNVILQDIFVRTMHLRGDSASRNLGMTHHSFFTLLNDSKKTFDNESSKNLIRQINYNKKQLKSLGLSCNWDNFDFTMSEKFTNFVRNIFVDLYNKKKIYEDKNIVYWDQKNKNVLSKTEIIYKKKLGKKYNIRYFVYMKRDSVVVGTFSPDTIFADVALAVNPTDKRYKKLIGKSAIIPIVNKSILIIGDDEVDIQENNGILRVTPCHDEFSLKIAQKHNLPLDQYAIDFDGCFTKNAGTFAGKKIEEFSKNIIQFLDDISNIDSVLECKYDVPVCKKTGEELQPLLTDQRFFKFNDDKNYEILEDITNGKIKFFPDKFYDEIKGFLSENMGWCISKQNCFGQRMPIWKDEKGESFIFDDDFIIEKYKSYKNKKSKKYLLSLIIFNIISDNLLPTEFDIEKLLDVFFSQSLTDFTKTKLEVYLELFQEKYGDSLSKEIQELHDIIAKNNIEKIEKIISLIDKTFLIKNLGDNKYIFEFNTLTGSVENPKQVEYMFDYGFSRVLGNIKNILQDTRPQKESYIMTGHNNISSWLCKLLILSYDYLGKKFDKIYLNNVLLDKNGKKLGFLSDNINPIKMIKNYGADVVRLLLMFDKADDKKDFQFEYEKISEYTLFTEKFWNACRFVNNRLQFIEAIKLKQAVSLSKIESEINNNIDKLTDFDSRILYALKNLIDELNYNRNKNTLLPYGKKTIEFIKKDFCDLYMEISKIQSGEITDLVLSYVTIVLLKIISPYAPFIAQKVWDNMILAEKINEKIQIDIVDTKAKSYRINLFFDIVSKIFDLKKKIEFRKHDLVDICIQASSDFLNNIKKYEAILFKIARISTIEYLGSNQDISSCYIVGNVIDINIGVRKMEKRSKKENLNDLVKSFEDKKEYLQYLRTLISKSSDTELINQKEKEMKKLKIDIENIEYEINKIKMNS